MASYGLATNGKTPEDRHDSEYWQEIPLVIGDLMVYLPFSLHPGG